MFINLKISIIITQSEVKKQGNLAVLLVLSRENYICEYSYLLLRF
jgi:hypothetical protein